jgi:hypothetical protein
VRVDRARGRSSHRRKNRTSTRRWRAWPSSRPRGLTLWVFPVLLGTGKRLFAEGTRPLGLELAGTATSSTGVAIQTYERGGEIQYGSF